jgi:hypothetical protein
LKKVESEEQACQKCRWKFDNWSRKNKEILVELGFGRDSFISPVRLGE